MTFSPIPNSPPNPGIQRHILAPSGFDKQKVVLPNGGSRVPQRVDPPVRLRQQILSHIQQHRPGNKRQPQREHVPSVFWHSADQPVNDDAHKNDGNDGSLDVQFRGKQNLENDNRNRSQYDQAPFQPGPRRLEINQVEAGEHDQQLGEKKVQVMVGPE